MDEAKNDPVKKADLIRDMVVSISKIKDRIQREIYVQETSRIMDISEQVLLNTLSQLIRKDISETGKKIQQEHKTFEVLKNETSVSTEKVDVLFELERKIIEILLLYGNKTEEFEDILLKANEEGEIENVTEKKEYKVYQRVFLSLQEDEVEFTNPLFREIYNDLIEHFHQNETLILENYLKELKPEFSQEVTDILMLEEQQSLHNWEGQQIIVKLKDQSIGQYVSETILTLRWFLVDKIIEELKAEISIEPDADNTEPLSMAMDYYKLINSFSKKLGRVMSRYS